MALKKKRSLLDRLTGRSSFEDEDRDEYIEIDEEEQYDIEEEPRGQIRNRGVFGNIGADNRSTWMDEQGDEGELSIDMYQTPDSIVIRTMIPGVKKDDLEINLSRDRLTLRGKRMVDTRIADQDYYHRELYWGTFSRTVELPHEVDIEQSEAIEKDGMLTLTLPRIDKGRQTKLKVKSV